MLDALEYAEAARRQGNPLLLHDLASAARSAGEPEDARFAFLQALALAQMGETERAEKAYDADNLGSCVDEDALSLRGRLLKDRALSAPLTEKKRLFEAAAEAYLEAFRLNRGYFPAINAATMAWAAGRQDTARSLACATLEHPDLATAQDFFAAATRVEALVLCDRVEEAGSILHAALAAAPPIGDRAIAYRQLTWIAAQPAAPAGVAALAARLRPPPVTVFCGAMFREDTVAEQVLRRAINAALDENGSLALFGALACGADLLFAEVALARGAELHVVLPFAETDFVAVSVAPGGDGWVPRYQACRAAAASVTIATKLGYMGHDAQFGHGSLLAMGMARLRAAQLGAGAVQMAVWDGVATGAAAGTGADIARWRRVGLPAIVIPSGPIDRRRDPVAGIVPYEGPKRVLRAVLFADFAGFSRLDEPALPRFWTEVMGHIGAIVTRHGSAVETSNTWGDALFAVIDGASVAATIALDIVQRLRSTALVDGTGGMRIGIHYGPMYADTDPVTQRYTFYGSEVTLAARIEPRVPPGQVYVTEAMAAVLAMEAAEQFNCRYVGRIELAKGYGTLSAYRLECRSASKQG